MHHAGIRRSCHGTIAPPDDLEALRHLALKIQRQIALKITRYGCGIGSHPGMLLLILTSIRTQDQARQEQRFTRSDTHHDNHPPARQPVTTS